MVVRCLCIPLRIVCNILLILGMISLSQLKLAAENSGQRPPWTVLFLIHVYLFGVLDTIPFNPADFNLENTKSGFLKCSYVCDTINMSSKNTLDVYPIRPCKAVFMSRM